MACCKVAFLKQPYYKTFIMPARYYKMKYVLNCLERGYNEINCVNSCQMIDLPVYFLLRFYFILYVSRVRIIVGILALLK